MAQVWHTFVLQDGVLVSMGYDVMRSRSIAGHAIFAVVCDVYGNHCIPPEQLLYVKSSDPSFLVIEGCGARDYMCMQSMVTHLYLHLSLMMQVTWNIVCSLHNYVHEVFDGSLRDIKVKACHVYTSLGPFILPLMTFGGWGEGEGVEMDEATNDSLGKFGTSNCFTENRIFSKGHHILVYTQLEC